MNLQNINFQPGLSAIFLNPFYIARKALFKSVRELAPALKGKLLDVGCGSKPYRNLFTVDEYIGMEIESTQYKETKTDIDVFYDGNTFPFPDHTFDSILCNQVLEHVFNPEHFLNEIQRVLKPGGQILLTVPFVWDEHEQPWDYARYSSFALKHLFEQHGFEMLQQIKTVNNVGVIYQLINGYLYKKTKWNRFLRIFTTVFIMPGFTLSGLILGAILPSNNDLYLDNVILARKC
jgi:SAM-dependent methyltransferase